MFAYAEDITDSEMMNQFKSIFSVAKEYAKYAGKEYYNLIMNFDAIEIIKTFKESDEVIAGSDENVIGGSVLDNLEKLIKEKNIEVIYSCGPTIVLKKLSILASSLNIPVFVAMEKTMACSIGVCRGCVIRLMKDNEITYYSVCKDGPVFKGSEIVWD